ncbi:hypothetical protein IGI04_026228 [Brassica rapa subsp. trilocularis]|uniref:Uncharacterized protein n=1 Tax=Brassica rapa subsp. trilocularis TaxID=1813537 RepID=A0ABQ7KY10_BRACM|nr:hypothetical protein IGI04_026228 [Brassica rapa subsp. trilocularis]
MGYWYQDNEERRKTLCLYYPLGAGVWGIWLSANATLQFDVELLSWSSVKDICKDGGVFKKIREKRETPKDLDEVLVKYEDGTVVRKSDGAEFHSEGQLGRRASQPLVVKGNEGGAETIEGENEGVQQKEAKFYGNMFAKLNVKVIASWREKNGLLALDVFIFLNFDF